MDSSALWKVLDRLVKSRPFEKNGVSRIVGLGLVKDPESDEYFDVFVSRPGTGAKDNPVASAELRTPGPEATVSDGIVLLELPPKPCVGEAEVRARYGEETEILPPSAHAPEDEPVYHVYRRAWGEMRFGFERGKPGCLRSVVLDATRE